MGIGPKYAWRVADYATYRPARAKCQLCAREWDVDLRPYPLYERLIDLEPRLKCTACGSRGHNYFIQPTNGLFVASERSRS